MKYLLWEWLMPIVKWRDSYSVGVKQFDEEHKVLLELINEMFVIVRDNQDVAHLDAAVKKLILYTQEHFADEEQALEEIDYPALNDHKGLHSKLLEDVRVYKKKVDEKDEEAVLNFYHFLRDWLLTHILEEDMLYKDYFADESVSVA